MSLADPNALVAVSKDILTDKLCCIKILQFLTGGVGYLRLSCILAVKRLLLLQC